MFLDDLKDFFAAPPPPERRFFVPEVIQTSAMDCGPAALKCMLEGFGIPVSYGRLREACQTDVDGTSIDVMEDVAVQLGISAEQVMVPADHLLIPASQTLPAIVIVRLPNGLTHFVVAWRLHGRFVQVMDPGKGRRWQPVSQFLEELYIHAHPVPAQAWRDWAGSEGFTDPLRHRLSIIGVQELEASALIDAALSDPGWRAIAALDASVRMVDTLVRAQGLEPGQEAFGVLRSFFTRMMEHPDARTDIVPAALWSVEKYPEPIDGEETLRMKGAVLVRVVGRRGGSSEEARDEEENPKPLSPELAAALREKPIRPEMELFKLLKKDGFFAPGILAGALMTAVLGVTIEALLFQGLMEIGQTLTLVGQRAGAALMILLFLAGLLLLEISVSSTVLRMGRRLETRLRVAFLEKIPRLGDRYFHSRLTSDMTQRVHELRWLRTLPGLGVSIIRIGFQIVLTAAGIIFFTPASAVLAILATVFTIALSFISQPLLMEQHFRLLTHLSAMSRFYLDGLLGLIPIRTHCADRPLRHEHESVMVEWVKTNKDFMRVQTLIQGIEALAGAGFSIWILLNYLSSGDGTRGILLLFYWTLNLPVLGKTLSDFAQQYPMHRGKILRIFEPLGAPEENETDGEPEAETPEAASGTETGGAAVTLENVTVTAGGQTILKNIDLNIAAAEHIAIVGPSGAGKSSLVGLLLGWHRPMSGEIRIDGTRLSGSRLASLRRETVWVDPEVQIWNRSLFENLRYGTYETDPPSLSTAIDGADLFSVLEKLPQGMQTRLGESGGLVSGGEGQRVRLGRGMLRSETRLVILDEPFRGLDREKRRDLLKRGRNHWKDATLIFISHDVSEALTFNRVVVIEEGQIVEDDAPQKLADMPDSRYRGLLDSDEAVRRGMWESSRWRRLWLENGKLTEKFKR
jgi:ATP-binding cassette subfamily B protein